MQKIGQIFAISVTAIIFVIFVSINDYPVFAMHQGEHHENMGKMMGQHHIPHHGMCAPGFASLGEICVLNDRCGPGAYAGKVCMMDGKIQPYLRPLHQKHAGISVDNIICAEGKQLMFKTHNAAPACINSDSIEKLKHRGWQTAKPAMACTLEYNPVCGMDGVTYGNPCMMHTEHMVMRHAGECMDSASITNFEDCVAAGNPVMESYPRQCNTSDGKHFVESIPYQKNPITDISADVIKANNQFTIDLYSDIAKDSSDNIFFSPWSVSTAFAIVHEGAKGNTADEIQQVFGFPADDEQRKNEFKTANDDLNQKDAKYQLSVANALWLGLDFLPHQEFVDAAVTFYDSEVQVVDFGLDGVDIINEWVSDKTQEKIKDLFEPGSLDSGTRLAITNAIYFKGTWVTQFDPEDTLDRNFWIAPDESISTPMMFLPQSPQKFGWTEELSLLELPYEGDKISMLILLPSERDGIVSLESSLTAENLSIWKNKLGESSIQVMLPKFKLETSYNLVPTLNDLGIHDAFGPADFSGISNSGLYIDQVVHKAFVDVNEEGTEAAAATGISMRESAPMIFSADHPFIFIIQDNETRNILFIGRVMEPENES